MVALDISEKMIEVLEAKNLPNVVTISDMLSIESIANSPDLQEKFDLIVASSVCSFLPNFEETLVLLKSLLSPTGVFVQWDWLITEDNSEYGFSENQIRTAYQNAGFSDYELNVAFSMEAENVGQVLMGVVRNQ